MLPLIIAGLSALGGGSAVAGGVAAAGTVGSMVMANQAKQQAKGLMGQAAAQSQVSIDALNEKIKEISRTNAEASAALEKALTPEVAKLKTDSTNAIAGGINDSSYNSALEALQGVAGQGNIETQRSPLLQAAIEKARANLALGGQLSPEIQNLVTRQGLATAGTVNPQGLGLGRDVVARDLGLTGLQLEQQRLTQAQSLGQNEQQANQFDTSANFQNRSNLVQIAQLLSQISGQRFGQNLAAGQFAQSIKAPVVGLDPASAGNIMAGNQANQAAFTQNLANIEAQKSQNLTNLGGQFLGYGLLNYNDYLGKQRQKNSGYPTAADPSQPYS